MVDNKNIHPERIIPSQAFGGPLAVHMKRYEFANKFCKGKTVLDAACGVGYGSFYLSKTAKEVAGVDISAEAIAYAKEHYQKENTRFLVMNACNLDFPERCFDVVCSFETLEHLDNPLEFLARVKRALKDDGVLIISTPHAKKTIVKPKNPYHKVELSRNDFCDTLRKYFNEVEILGQRRRQSLIHCWIQKADIFHLSGALSGSLRRKICHGVATHSWDEASVEDFIIGKEAIGRATELIGVCRK